MSENTISHDVPALSSQEAMRRACDLLRNLSVLSPQQIEVWGMQYFYCEDRNHISIEVYCKSTVKEEEYYTDVYTYCINEGVLTWEERLV